MCCFSVAFQRNVITDGAGSDGKRDTVTSDQEIKHIKYITTIRQR